MYPDKPTISRINEKNPQFHPRTTKKEKKKKLLSSIEHLRKAGRPQILTYLFFFWKLWLVLYEWKESKKRKILLHTNLIFNIFGSITFFLFLFSRRKTMDKFLVGLQNWSINIYDQSWRIFTKPKDRESHLLMQLNKNL